MDVRVGGVGRGMWLVLRETRSSTVNSSSVTGSFPFSDMYFSISLRSKTLPVRSQLLRQLSLVKLPT